MGTVKRRVVSLDVFRGLAIAAMIFVNILPENDFVPFYLHHAQWIGIYFADLVFPFFLFIVGVSMAYAFKSRANESPARKWGLFFLRVAVLFLLGLFINWLADPSDLTIRIPGVLQLIALSSLFAAPFARLKPRWIVLAAGILMVIHSLFLLKVAVPGLPPGILEPGVNIAGWIDMHVFGSAYMYTENFDPEGIISIISTTALVLLGLSVGRTLQIRGGNKNTLKIFLIAGIISIVLGLLATSWLPVIKQLWTSSFILIMAGFGTLLLVVLYTYLDLMGKKSILLLALPMGRNALFIYVFAAIVTALMQTMYLSGTDGSIQTIYDSIMYYDVVYLSPMWVQIIFAMLFVAFWGIIAYILHQKKIYIKL
ncbi:MAG: acyltransferase family protein [Methanobacterium sp.]